ncbi:MAG: hypothetical protein DMF80_22530 [Acidobacteria bacterium]|nr:MAG: hypothetical protein DMF80_22530 [Acidobacteriota bacterium]PYQ24947.1 MAG: hypothetical protein DMF81_04000 [Acidobacteriota bacterium]
MGLRAAAALLLGLAAPVAGQPARAVAARSGSPEALLSEIDRLGAPAVVSELYEDDRRWEAVRGGIASGAKAWLEVARRLKRDAETSGPGQDLTEAVASALERAPASVLSVLDGESFDADDVCSLNTIEDSLGNDFHAALRTVERRERAVAAVADPALAGRKKDCLGFLRELKREVVRNRASWFGDR